MNEPKYSIGQELFVVRFNRYFSNNGSKTCPNCNGDYHKTLDNGTWICNNCYNGKIKANRSPIYIVDTSPTSYKVQQINIYITSKSQEEIVYLSRGNTNTISCTFTAGNRDELNDIWGDNDHNDYCSVGIPVKWIHSTLKDAIEEINRVKKIIDIKIFDKAKSKASCDTY